MSALSGSARSKLVKVLGLLASNHDGERAAAGLAATRIVSCAGLKWDDLLQPASSPRAEHAYRSRATGEGTVRLDIRFCQQHLDKLNLWEREFVQSLATRSRLSGGQNSKLAQIVTELRKRSHA